MKKFILSALAGAAFAVPVFAHIPFESNTHDAMHCMKLRECTDGVYEMNASDYWDEVENILINLEKMGVKVYEASSEYFVDEYRALYYSDINTIFLNKKYMDDMDTVLRLLRHEGWHAAQDCMAGGMHNSDILSILDHKIIPSYVMDETFLRYGYDPTVVRVEREAVWAMKVKGMTVKALESCNSDVPMWETYFPPKRTWRYLYWNGHLKGYL